MKVSFILDLTESEHEIVCGHMTRLCERLDATITYQKLEPHVPCKRRVTIEGDEDTIFTLDAIAYSDESRICFE